MAPESVGEPSSACWEWDVTASIVPEIVSEDWTNGAAQAGKHACCVLIFSISARIQNSVQLEKSFLPTYLQVMDQDHLWQLHLFSSLCRKCTIRFLNPCQLGCLANIKVFLGSCLSSCVPASWQTEKQCQWSASLLAATLEAGKQKRHVSGLPACWQPLLNLCASQLANRKGTSVACQLAGQPAGKQKKPPQWCASLLVH